MQTERKPQIVMSRREYSRVLHQYSDDLQPIWRSLWLSRQIDYYGEHAFTWMFISFFSLMTAYALYFYYPYAALIGLTALPSMRIARRNVLLCRWYRIKLSTVIRSRKKMIENANRLLSEARNDIVGEEPTITIDVEFNPGELPEPV